MRTFWVNERSSGSSFVKDDFSSVDEMGLEYLEENSETRSDNNNVEEQIHVAMEFLDTEAPPEAPRLVRKETPSKRSVSGKNMSSRLSALLRLENSEHQC
jgi:hypothetical protein